MTTRIKGYCSHCLEETFHIEQEWNLLRRNVYVCDSCKKRTLMCRACKNFTKGGDLWDDELCVVHDRTVDAFPSKIKLKTLEDYQHVNKNKSIHNFEINKIKNGNGHSVLFVDGFLTEEDSNRSKWEQQFKKIYAKNPLYSLSWKSKSLSDLIPLKKIASHIGLRTIATPTDPINLITNFPIIWREANNNAEQTGIILANILDKVQNQKFILCGHSLGAKVIYNALIQLSNVKSRTCIKNVHLLGGAVSSADDNWMPVQKYAEEINNYYSMNDNILKYLYQSAVLKTCAPTGITPIASYGIKNHDVSSFVNGHYEYINNFYKFAEV